MAVSAVKKEPAKGQEAASAAAVASPKKNIRKYLKIFIILSVMSGAGGGAYWYLNHNKGGKSAEAKMQPAKPPVFVPLDAFTVNLQLEESPQFLQAGLSLKVSDSTVADALKLYMPEVRDRILLLLSGKKASELLTADGKRKLSSEIVAAVNAILDRTAAEPTPSAKAAPETPPPAATEAAAPADSEEKPPADAAAPATAVEPLAVPATAPAAEPPAVAKSRVLSVLFTSFIVQ